MVVFVCKATRFIVKPEFRTFEKLKNFDFYLKRSKRQFLTKCSEKKFEHNILKNLHINITTTFSPTGLCCCLRLNTSRKAISTAHLLSTIIPTKRVCVLNSLLRHNHYKNESFIASTLLSQNSKFVRLS